MASPPFLFYILSPVLALHLRKGEMSISPIKYEITMKKYREIVDVHLLPLSSTLLLSIDNIVLGHEHEGCPS